MTTRISIHYIFFIFLALLFFSGCSSTPKPPIAAISLNAQPANHIRNENNEPEPRPVVIRTYELKSLETFNVSDFFSIFHHHKETLSNELLSSEEFYLRPNQKLKINRTLNFDTRYFAVVAAFREIELAQWKASTSIPIDESKPEIFILVKENQVQIGARPECGFFCKLWTPKAPAGTLYEVIEQTE